MKTPYYVIAASVPSGNRFRGFFNEDADGLKYTLLATPTFRHSGFDLRTLGTPQAGPEESWEVSTGERKLLRVYKDGTLLFRAAADNSFLGWGQEDREFQRFPRLNPVPSVEIHAAFAKFYAGLIPRLTIAPEHINFTLSLHNAVWDGMRLFLTEHFKVPLYHINNPTRYFVHDSNPTDQIVVSADDVIAQPLAVGYRLLERFAAFFDMPPDKIPFVKQAAGGAEIDVEALAALR